MSRNRLMRVLMGLIMAAGLVFVGSSAAGAADCGYGGCVVVFKIADTVVVAGQTVEVSGSGCEANAPVTITIGDTTVGTTTTDGDGNYTGTITIPDLPPGKYTVNADCGTGVLGIDITIEASSTPGTTPGTTTTPLARTGSDLGPLAALGAAAVVLGGAAVYGTRRRRQAA